MKRALRLLLPITFLAAILAPGCYTVVMHPVDNAGYRAAAVSDCTRCHADYGEYPYGYYYSPYPSYWWDYPHYGEYYAHPWWWSRYDQGGSDVSDNAGDEESNRGTKYDRRETDGPPPPPYAYPNVGLPHSPGTGLAPNDFRDTGGGTTGSTRPQTESGTPSRDKTEQNDKAEPVKSDTKASRQEPTKTRPEPQKESTVKNEPPKTDTSTKDAPKKEEEKPPRKGMYR